MRIDPEDVRTCIEDEVERYGDGAAPTAAPIVQTSLFSFPTMEDLVERFTAEHRHHIYSRGQNPTVEEFERKVAALERGEACKAFASGMAAVSAVFMGLLQAGDHVVFFNQIYGPTLQLVRQLGRFGITHDVVLELDVDALEAALRPETRLIWVESPGTMLFRVADLAAVAELGRSRGITTAIDNTWTTPLLQKPLTLGFDVVMQAGCWRRSMPGYSFAAFGLCPHGSGSTKRRRWQWRSTCGTTPGWRPSITRRSRRTPPWWSARCPDTRGSSRSC
jgi:cystathionine beta-lyase/cystathionine gamma-synthase